VKMPGHEKPHRRWDDRWWIKLSPWLAAVVALLMAAWALWGAETKTDRQILRVEQQNEINNRTTAYRLCNRNMVDRAFAHSRIKAGGGQEALPPLERIDGIPILNCQPNLSGRGASKLNTKAQRDYVDRWERGQLTREELGICPQSVFGDLAAATDC
jgi:hypothetical protein